MKFGLGLREWDEGVVVKANRIRQLVGSHKWAGT